MIVYGIKFLERTWHFEGEDNYYSNYRYELVLNNVGEQPKAYPSRKAAEKALEKAGYIPNPRPTDKDDKTWVTYGYSAEENYNWRTEDCPRPLIPVAEIFEIEFVEKDEDEDCIEPTIEDYIEPAVSDDDYIEPTFEEYVEPWAPDDDE
jgi:hypothetical protein